jgi:hypothetical protein
MPPLLKPPQVVAAAPKPVSRPVKLRAAQLRILKVLARAIGGLSKAAICSEVAQDFPTAAKFKEWMADPIGAADPANRPKAEKRAGYPSLLTLGYIVTWQIDLDGVQERLYKITDAGRQALS